MKHWKIQIHKSNISGVFWICCTILSTYLVNFKVREVWISNLRILGFVSTINSNIRKILCYWRNGYPKSDFRLTGNLPKNGLKASWTYGSSSFFAKFLPYMMIFQSVACQRCCVTLKNDPKIWQKMNKSLVQLAFNLFLHGIMVTQNPGFGYHPFCHYLKYALPK